MIYVGSDTHFGHKNILTFERKDFLSIEEHDEKIFKILEKTLSKDSTFYHLGDFGDLSDKTMSRFAKLPGKKILIRGNHDNSINKLKQIFDEVHNEPIFYKKRILFSHEPLPVTDGSINIHGHLHGAILRKQNYINANIHYLNYRLLTEKEIERMIVPLQKDNFKFLKEWYAKDYIFLDDKEYIEYFPDGEINIEQSLINLEKLKERNN